MTCGIPGLGVAVRNRAVLKVLIEPADCYPSAARSGKWHRRAAQRVDQCGTDRRPSPLKEYRENDLCWASLVFSPEHHVAPAQLPPNVGGDLCDDPPGIPSPLLAPSHRSQWPSDGHLTQLAWLGTTAPAQPLPALP